MIQAAHFKNLRKLYNKGSVATGTRRNIKITLTPETFKLLENEVPVGKGKFGSALIELSLRTFIVLVNNGEDIEYIAKEIAVATDSPYLAANLRLLAKYVDS